MPTYTLLVSGEHIQLTADQINSDPGNAFAKYFFSPSNKSPEYHICIESEPGLFRLVQAHLRGYDIFPIPDGSVPYMNGKTVLKNLLKEAETYELYGLVDKIREAQNALPVEWKLVKQYEQTELTTIRVLNEAEYNSILSQANSASESRELLSPREQQLTLDGYTAAISWVDLLLLPGGQYPTKQRVHFVLLLRNPSTSGHPV